MWRTFSTGWLWPFMLVAPVATLAEPSRPNVVLFLVDDMGWRDCGAYGSRYYETPQIDRLAREGIKFTDAYAANPLCSPTRASILTGKYPARLGLTSAVGHLPPLPEGAPRYPENTPPGRPITTPESRRYLPPAEYTLAEALRDAGYRTGHFGKWHLGLTEPHWPERQGYDVAWHGKPDPGPPGPNGYFSPYSFKAGTITPGPEGEYIVDRLTDEAIRFIEESHEQSRPFFAAVWQYGVHGPWDHKEEYTKQFADKQDPQGRQGNPVMASMLKSVDESLGRIVAKAGRARAGGEHHRPVHVGQRRQCAQQHPGRPPARRTSSRDTRSGDRSPAIASMPDTCRRRTIIRCGRARGRSTKAASACR